MFEPPFFDQLPSMTYHPPNRARISPRFYHTVFRIHRNQFLPCLPLSAILPGNQHNRSSNPQYNAKHVDQSILSSEDHIGKRVGITMWVAMRMMVQLQNQFASHFWSHISSPWESVFVLLKEPPFTQYSATGQS